MPASLLRNAGFGSLDTQSAYQSMSFVSHPLTPLSRPVSLGEGTATMQPPSLTTFSSAAVPPTGASGLPARATVTSTVEARNPTAKRLIPTLPAGMLLQATGGRQGRWRRDEARRAGAERDTSRQKGSAPVLKVEPNLFGRFDLRQSDGELVRCEKKASAETECRVAQEGRPSPWVANELLADAHGNMHPVARLRRLGILVASDSIQ